MDSSARFRALGDHYTIGHVLGKGSSSVVRLGIHRISQQRVAVKCVDTSDALKKKRVLNEIEVMERLEHPNVIR
jgi:serine/threonine protein kinase